MKERPILFSAPMVRAILTGTKTQTRRVLPTMTTLDRVEYPGRRDRKGYSQVNWLDTPEGMAAAVKECRYGQPGDRLWVRETWYCDDYRVQRGPYLQPADMDLDEARSDGTLIYRASSGDRPYEAEQPVWRPAIHMPRWASRITLEITGVRVERLQSMSSDDAYAEGAAEWAAETVKDGSKYPNAVAAFRALWQSINGPESWDANPWVWAIEFKHLKGQQ